MINIWAFYAKRVNVCTILLLAVNCIETLLFMFRAVWFNCLQLHPIHYAVFSDGCFMFDAISYGWSQPTSYERITWAVFNTKFGNLWLDPFWSFVKFVCRFACTSKSVIVLMLVFEICKAKRCWFFFHGIAIGTRNRGALIDIYSFCTWSRHIYSKKHISRKLYVLDSDLLISTKFK